ncbi:hypothetical protein ACYULU_16575 [Breznakiellaceae bacterium SP9]
MLSVNAEELKARGWDCCDFIFVSGDAYVDHPLVCHRTYRLGA